MNDLEDRLRRTLRTAAEQAPYAPVDLTRRVTGRRRDRRAQILTVAAAAIAVAAAVAAPVVFLDPAPVRPAVMDATPSSSPDLSGVEFPPSIQQVWPKAIHEIPAELPNGRKFQPLFFLDAGKVLVSTESSFEKVDMLASYDLATGETKDLVRVITPANAELFASEFTAGSGVIAWTTSRRAGDQLIAEIWTAPVTGGEASVLGSINDVGEAEGGAVHGLSVAGDSVYWSTGGTGGVWRLPLTGSVPAAQVPGTEGYHMFDYPWVGKPDEYSRSSYTELLNVESGETRTAVGNENEGWVCGLTRCVGDLPRESDGAGPPTLTATRLRDGSAQRTFPALSGGGHTMITMDRFTFLMIDDPGAGTVGMALTDLVSGEMADLGLRPNADGSFSYHAFRSPDSDLYAYALKGKQIIVDLKAIE
ncbi:hypothetical protein GCM10009555_079730 [Acrocarpospora macrocephala]|uniref:Uncharacterized protein n=1 Tax=Acrocarpospora macrocephala TaxID=150177 RepID=A0A5M3WYT0_9ACTN|nr:hypothetical protein [Acrocarpospora macrocephala]GES13930.1 hypothetical protein Amac_075270 [Acrocarpospora macrocephala]